MGQVSICGKLEPIYFSITLEEDRQIAEIYTLKAGYMYRREFGTTDNVADILSAMKSDLFNIQLD